MTKAVYLPVSARGYRRSHDQRHFNAIMNQEKFIMSLGTILIILLIIFLLGGFSGRFGGYGYGFGNGGIGVIGAVLIVVVVLLLMGRI